jgi:hypothetical protein
MDKKGDHLGGSIEAIYPREILVDRYLEISLEGWIIRMESSVIPLTPVRLI